MSRFQTLVVVLGLCLASYHEAHAVRPDAIKVQVLEPENKNPAGRELEYLELSNKKSVEVKAITATEIIQPLLDVANKATEKRIVKLIVENLDEINQAKSLAETPDLELALEISQEIDFSRVRKLEWSIAARALAELPKYRMTTVAVKDAFQAPAYGTVCFELHGMFQGRGVKSKTAVKMKVPAEELIQLEVTEVIGGRKYWVVAQNENREIFGLNQFFFETQPLFSISWDSSKKNDLLAGRSVDACVLNLSFTQKKSRDTARSTLNMPRSFNPEHFSNIAVYVSEPDETLLAEVLVRSKK